MHAILDWKNKFFVFYLQTLLLANANIRTIKKTILNYVVGAYYFWFNQFISIEILDLYVLNDSFSNGVKEKKIVCPIVGPFFSKFFEKLFSANR